MTGDQLLTLARLYTAHHGISLRQLGRRALQGNHKFFVRLGAGGGVNTKSIARARIWLADNWPTDLDWPDDIPRPEVNRPRCAA